MEALPLRSGNTISSSQPAVFAPASYDDLHNAVAKGLITVHGVLPSTASNFFRVNDGCSDLLFDGLEFAALWRVWVTATERVTFRNCHFHHNRMEGMILGACTDAVIEDCIAEFCGPQYMTGYADSSHREPSAAHAYYPQNYGGKRTTMRRCIGQHVSGSGLHLYGNGDNGDYGSEFTGEDLAFYYCGSEGTPAIQADGTENSHLSNLLVAHPPIGGFTWGNGDGMPCRNWVIDGLTLWNPDAKFNIHVSPGTRGITYRNSVFVLADAPLCEGTEEGDFEYPTFENCLVYAPGVMSLPPGCHRRPLSQAAALFPRALQNDFTPTDLAVPGFRDWRQQPTPTPEPKPPTDPLTAVRAALNELDEPLSALWHHASGVRNTTLRATLRADQAALAAGVAKAKAVAG